MAVPPPPAPPAPPPQPLAKIGGGSTGGDARSALLQSIQKGTKLKKTVTVDKRAPVISGKLVSNNASPARQPGRRPDGVDGAPGADGPKLAGIFEGMSSMPKLKPVGARGVGQVSPVSPARDTVDAEASRNERVNDNVALDFNSELTKHLTLKKQKQQQQKSVTEANLKINRGPPPNPPLKTSTLTPPDNESPRGGSSQSPEAKRLQNIISGQPSGNGESSSVGVSSGAVANKSSLFNTMANQVHQVQKPNHGKPNLAPKPPGAPPGGAPGKTSVARHHSMKSPRSPPATPSNLGGPVFPTGSHFGTLRGTQQLFQSSQESIHVNGRPSGRPTVAPPPRPPASRPPPPPVRSISNTNLSNLPTNTLSTPISDPQTTSSSLNNVSALKEQLRHQIPGGVVRPSETKVVTAVNGNVAPPLPPHRTCPAPPPPVTRQVNNASNVPPVPPQRHSSIRSSTGATMSDNNESIGNGRMVIDLEAKFAMRFHAVTDFPKPSPFTNAPKNYASSHTSRTSNG
uniref:WH2 domain-containing protein n=1 Tax=Lutzomyia longipalpis TaxID=7200 RepID=A0A1B0C9E1_LUTLO